MLLPEDIVADIAAELRELPLDGLQQSWQRYNEEGELLTSSHLVLEEEFQIAPSDFLLATMLQSEEEDVYAHAVVRTDVDPPRALLWCRDYKLVLRYYPDGVEAQEPRAFSGKAEDRVAGNDTRTRIGHLQPGKEWMDEEVRRGFAEGFDILTACLKAQAERGQLDDIMVPFLAIPEHGGHLPRAAVVDFSEDVEPDFSGTVFQIPLGQDFPMGETLRRYIDLLDDAPFEASTIILPAGRSEGDVECYFFSYDRRNSGVGLVRFVLAEYGGSWGPKEIEFFDSDQLVDIIRSGD